MKIVFQFFVALPVYAFFYFFKALPVAMASWLGGKVAQILGPRLPVNRRVQRNLATIFPDREKDFYTCIVRDMWGNLGRNIGELPHLRTLLRSGCYIESKNTGLLPESSKNQPFLLFSGHFGNWELLPSLVVGFVPTPLHLVYRKINNPFIERLLYRARGYANSLVTCHPKGSQGAKACLKALRQNENVGMLLDQKMNDGIDVNFLGHSAMTASAMASLALRFKLPLYPIRIIRKKGCHFIFEVCEPFHTENFNSVRQLTQAINDSMGQWVMDNPGQWFWVHNRWKFSKK